jgi:non-ribosomal peptide synthetase component F
LLEPERSSSYSPLFQVMFALQSFSRGSVDGGELKPVPVEHDPGRAKFDLSLEITASARGLWCYMEYATDLFERTTIERMLRNFEVLLESIVSNPREAVAELSLLTPGERHRILLEWNDTSQA